MIRVKTIKQIESSLFHGRTVMYCKLQILEVKGARVRTNKGKGFFKPWLPAVIVSSKKE